MISGGIARDSIIIGWWAYSFSVFSMATSVHNPTTTAVQKAGGHPAFKKKFTAPSVSAQSIVTFPQRSFALFPRFCWQIHKLSFFSFFLSIFFSLALGSSSFILAARIEKSNFPKNRSKLIIRLSGRKKNTPSPKRSVLLVVVVNELKLIPVDE